MGFSLTYIKGKGMGHGLGVACECGQLMRANEKDWEEYNLYCPVCGVKAFMYVVKKDE